MTPQDQDDPYRAALLSEMGGTAPINTTMPVGGAQTTAVREPVAPGGPKEVSNAQNGLGAVPTAAPSPDDERAWRMQLRQKAIGSGGPGRSYGWNTGDYGGDDVAATSMKNTFHAIAQNFPTTPSGLRKMMQSEDFKRAFPNAKLVEHPTGDKIDFGGQLSDYTKGRPVGVVDVGRAFDGTSDTGEGWDWMDEADAMPADPSMGGASPLELGDLGDGGEGGEGGASSLEQILARLQELGGGEGGEAGGDPFRDALLEEMQ